jgi:hypothetical protein
MSLFSNKQYKAFQKPIAGFLIFLICFSLLGGVFYPKKAEAGALPVICVNCAMEPTQSAGWAANAVNFVKDYGIGLKDLAIAGAEWAWNTKNSALKMAMASFRKMLLDYMVDEIVRWIQGGGEPRFITDWEGFLLDVADQAGGKFLEELLGSDVMAGLCRSDWAIKVNIALQKPPRFATQARCTLTDIGANFDDFMDNFNNGGWKAWIKVSEAQNNPYGFYLMALNEKLAREAEAKTGAKMKAETGKGFLGDDVCEKITCSTGGYGPKGGVETETKTGVWDKNDIPSGCSCDKWTTKTPGHIAAVALDKSVFKDIEWLQNNEEWESYIVAITNALVNRMIKEGVMSITSQDVSGSEGGSPGSPTSNLEDLFDSEPAVTTASFFDPWRVKITANEPAFIYYTLDGAEPSISSSVYIDPIQITSSGTLKWFSVDYNGNKEGVHAMDLAPPFTVPEQPEPSSIAVAVDSSGIALISSEPSTIYYTTDSTVPNTSSSRYIKKIDLSQLALIQWFSVNTQGVQETVINSLSTSPPFPNADLTEITDLVAPTAGIIAPSSASANQFFELDPSASWDDDNSPKIVMYEWDFDNDGEYDWWTVDWNRDGVFDEEQCRSGAVCTDPASGISNGFSGMNVPSSAQAGVVEVKYSSGTRDITLRVTDDEGLWTTVGVTVDVQ